MALVLASAISAVLEMDHVGTAPAGSNTIYTFKTTSLIPSLVELKSKVMSILDFPIDIPMDVNVREVKRGIIFKEYIVDITVDANRVGDASNLLAKKYGILRERPYKQS